MRLAPEPSLPGWMDAGTSASSRSFPSKPRCRAAASLAFLVALYVALIWGSDAPLLLARKPAASEQMSSHRGREPHTAANICMPYGLWHDASCHTRQLSFFLLPHTTIVCTIHSYCCQYVQALKGGSSSQLHPCPCMEMPESFALRQGTRSEAMHVHLHDVSLPVVFQSQPASALGRSCGLRRPRGCIGLACASAWRLVSL